MNSISKSSRLPDLRCIDALTLKCIAMALMLCDHLWATVASQYQLLTDLGRLAFPIFAFQIAEAFHYTHDRKRLLLRMLVFALLSELPFNLMTGGSWIYPFHQNVMFTFFIALLFLCWMEKARQTGVLWKYLLVCAVSLVLGVVLGTAAMVDYFGFGVATVFVFYWARQLRFGWVLQIVGLWLINVQLLGGLVIPVTLFGTTFELPQQGLALLALPLIWLYNGKRGAHTKPIQIAYYAFYPVHMLVLSVLSLLGL